MLLRRLIALARQHDKDHHASAASSLAINQPSCLLFLCRLIALARQHGKDHEASGLLFEKA